METRSNLLKDRDWWRTLTENCFLQWKDSTKNRTDVQITHKICSVVNGYFFDKTYFIVNAKLFSKALIGQNVCLFDGYFFHKSKKT